MTKNAESGPYQAYLDAIRGCVCAVCLDRRDDATCGLAGARICAIEEHLPSIVEAVKAIHSDRMDDYIDAIQKQICRNCAEDEAGNCRFRDRGECAAWTYLPLLVDAVDEVRQASSPGRPGEDDTAS